MKLPFKVDLTNQVAVVTGAGGIICGEFAKALAECGAKVALLDINLQGAQAMADQIGENAFGNCKLSKIYVPSIAVLEKIKNAGLSNITGPDENGKYTF